MTIFDTTTIKLPELDSFVIIPPAPAAKLLQQLDEEGITTPPKSGNQTGVADLYTITLR